VRFVIAEKDIDGLRIELVKPGVASEDLLVLNPSQGVPTLADREVVLTEAQIMIEYLDERYPHPPLMPVEPAARARLRSALVRMRQDLFPVVQSIRTGPATVAQKARKALAEALPSIAQLITPRGHFLTGEFNMADCAWATLLWRLPALGIKPGAELKVLQKYADKLFARPAFHQSLTEAERALPR
jgi:RNA polymerase-associated protein